MYDLGDILYLRLRKENGLWVFDDPKKGLFAEAFAEDATVPLDKMIQSDAGNGLTPVLAFSVEPFATFAEFEFVREENGGVIYRATDRFRYMEAWFGPQFGKYFSGRKAPDTIYARVFDTPVGRHPVDF